jgi:uncharacterized membrane protein
MFGLALVLGHDLLDGLHAASLGQWWKVVHERGMIALPGHLLNIIYPLVPWPGVMAAGYWFGALYTRPEAERRRVLLRLGGALCLAFVAVRAFNHYGDPHPWTSQPTPLYTLFSFLACSKYPPSLDYLLMTLGPAILLLGLIEGLAARRSRPLVIFGRVPFFYYVVHVWLLHGAAVLTGMLVFGAAAAPSFAGKMFLPPAQYAHFGFALPIVYLAWALAVLALYPACRWFAGVKARNRAAWLSYL